MSSKFLNTLDDSLCVESRDDALLTIGNEFESEATSLLRSDSPQRSSTSRSREAPTVLPKYSSLVKFDPTLEAANNAAKRRHSASSNRVIAESDRNNGCSDSSEQPLTQREFDELHGGLQLPKQTIMNCNCFRKCSFRRVVSVICSFMPFIGVLQRYNIRSDLLRDLIAGLTVCVMHIPQGMAYGMLSGLPAVYGLYSSVFPVFVYFFFGSSRHISVGTFAVVTLMVSVPVLRLTDSLPAYQPNVTSTVTSEAVITEPLYWFYGQALTKTECRVQVAIAVTLLTGLIQITMAMFRLGFLTIYMSQAMVNGFTTGAAFHVMTSQVVYIIGYNPSQHYSGALKLIYIYVDLVQNYANFNSISLAISVVCITVLLTVKEKLQPLVSKRVNFPIPVDLVLIVAGTVVSYALALGPRYHVMIIGTIPSGFPPPQVPDVRIFSAIVTDCLLIAVVSYAITISMAKIFANKHGYEVSGNQELLALGLSNSIACFFNCHANSASLSRSVVQEGAGCRSQVTSLFSCVALTLIILYVAPLFETVPDCVLASIILVALKGMFMQLKDLPRLWKTSKFDLSIWLVAFVSTVIIDVDYGLILGLLFSIGTLLYRTQCSYACVLGQIANTRVYRDVATYRDAREIDGIKVFRFDGPLHFASSEHFRSQLFDKTALLHDGDSESENNGHREMRLQISVEQNVTNNDNVLERNSQQQIATHHLVIDCSAINFIDETGVSALTAVCDECAKHAVTVLLASSKWRFRNALDKMNFFKKFPRDMMYVTVDDAVTAALSCRQDDEEMCSTSRR